MYIQMQLYNTNTIHVRDDETFDQTICNMILYEKYKKK